jgi:SPP1 gp7 family putative phage head morphogenesis protein
MATLQETWRQQNNRLYWEKREQKQRELYMMEEAQQQKELEKIYAEMYRHAEDEINRFYGKYADAEGIDITEAKKRVTQADIKAYEQLAKEYVKNKNFSGRANAEMRLYNATMKINRLEMLKARIGVYMVAGINDIDQYYEKVITDRTRQEIERQAGILGETVSVADTTKRAENIVNASFFNATYSERIWSHQDRLRSMINIELQKGLIAGIGSRQMASNIRKEYDVSLADAHRLMVTELRRVQTDVAMDSYKASGVQKYVYMAVNPRACPICREIDGNVYDVADAEPAKNAPPMHPRCHCTTAPYVDESEYDMWLEWLNKGGTTSDWNTMSDAEKRAWYRSTETTQGQASTDTFAPAKTIAEAEIIESDE